jgi:hypothetical protein
MTVAAVHGIICGRQSGGKCITQKGFSAIEFAAKTKRTFRERFPEQIEAATPWALLVGLIEPHCPKAEHGPAVDREPGRHGL